MNLATIVRNWKKSALIVLVMLLASVAYVALRGGDKHLVVYWEGLFVDRNFRDVGQSMNECLGESVFREGLLYRSGEWFSGWSCAGLQYPERIISLNFDPAKGEKCYCWDDRVGAPNIGIVPDPTIRLDGLEKIERWELPAVRHGACAAVRELIQALRERRKTLFHCTSGRDRTGAMAALLGALALEEAGRLDEHALEALECDYRKTESLELRKYGRISTFISAIRQQGSVAQFLSGHCDIAEVELHDAARQLLADPVVP